MHSCEKALSKKKGKTEKEDKKVLNSVKGSHGDLGEKGNKVRKPYSFSKVLGAKNNDSEEF